MLKKIGIGCGAFVGIIILIAVIVAIAGGGGGDEYSSDEADATPPPFVNAQAIWREYESNETRANNPYKNIWLRVQLDTISKVESGGKVQMYMDSSGFNHIELDFKHDDDVLELNPGQSVTAICKLSGFELDSWLNFRDCRFP